MGCGASSVPPPLEDARRAWSPLLSPTRRRRSQAHIQRRRQPLRSQQEQQRPAAAPAPAEDPRADWDDSEDDDAPAADIPLALLPTGWSGVRNAHGKLCIDSTYGELRLICTRCSFLVPRSAGYAWCDDVDYFHVRNYTPDPRASALEETRRSWPRSEARRGGGRALVPVRGDDPRRSEALGRTCSRPHGGTGQARRSRDLM